MAKIIFSDIAVKFSTLIIGIASVIGCGSTSSPDVERGPAFYFTDVDSNRFKGHVYDAEGVNQNSFKINNIKRPLNNDHFDWVTIPSNGIVSLTAANILGEYRTEQYLEKGRMIKNSASTHMSMSAMNTVADIIEQKISNSLVNDILVGKSLTKKWSGLEGYALVLEVDLGERPELDIIIEHKDDGAELVIIGSVPEFRFWADAGFIWDGEVDGDETPMYQGWVKAQVNMIRAKVTITSNSNRDISATVSDITADADVFFDELDLQPPWWLYLTGIAGWLFVQEGVPAIAEGMADDLIDGMIPDITDDINTTIENTLAGFGNQLNIAIGDTVINTQHKFENINSQRCAISIDLNSKIATQTPSPDVVSLGSIYQTTPPLNTAIDFHRRQIAVSLNANTINQALSSVQQSGLLNFELTHDQLMEMIGDKIAPFIGSAEFNAQLQSKRAPSIQLIQNNLTPLKVALNDYAIVIGYRPNDGQDYSPVLMATLHYSMNSGLTLETDDDGNSVAQIKLGTPSIDYDVPQLGNSLAEIAAKQILNSIAPEIIGVLNEQELLIFPIPSYGGVKASNPYFTVNDPGKGYLTIATDITSDNANVGNYEKWCANNESGSKTNRMYSGDRLSAGQELYSNPNNPFFRLVMQNDGNLVIYRRSDNKVYWSSNTSGNRASFRLDETGNLKIVRNSDSRVLWKSDTNNSRASKLVLQSDGNLVLRCDDGTAIWSSMNGKESNTCT